MDPILSNMYDMTMIELQHNYATLFANKSRTLHQELVFNLLSTIQYNTILLTNNNTPNMDSIQAYAIIDTVQYILHNDSR
jgi:hypothetical protein